MSDPAPVSSGVLRGLDISISSEAVFRELGYPSPEQTPAVVQSTFRRILSHGLPFLNACIIFRTFPGYPAFAGAHDNTFSCSTPTVTDAIQSTGLTAYFAGTLGERFDAHLRFLNRRGEFLAAMVWDAIGTVATGGLVSSLKAWLRQEYENFGWTKVRSGPAAVTELPGVLRLAQAERLPVVLSEPSKLLSPSKSLAGYLHIGPS